MKVTRLQCRCAAIELELAADPIAQFYCHCDDCQVVHGAAYVPESLYPAAAVTITRGSALSWTLLRNPRFFCPTCGTRLFVDVLAFRLRGVNGYLLPSGAFNPTFHMHCQFAIRPLRDDLPHYRAKPAQFGGSEEFVDW